MLSKRAGTASGELKSARTNEARPPVCLICSTTCDAVLEFLFPCTRTSAPLEANFRAIAAPMPREEPVTNADRFVRSIQGSKTDQGKSQSRNARREAECLNGAPFLCFSSAGRPVLTARRGRRWPCSCCHGPGEFGCGSGSRKRKSIRAKASGNYGDNE